MEFVQDLLPGVQVVRLGRFDDPRGSFVKTYSRTRFEAAGLPFDVREEFYSFSRKDVIRGMHFQMPPHDHAKLVYCAQGAVLDVLIDLRCGPGYGKVASIVLHEDEPMALAIPSGVAHGFKSLRDASMMVYKTSTEHAPSHDAGIRWDSIEFEWDIQAPVVSARDSAHSIFADFASPF